MTIRTKPEFDYQTTDRGLGYNLPQKMGRRLWAPMFLMALMGFTVGIILAFVRADEIAGDRDPETLTALQHLVPAFMFIGFLSVLAAISFAIARILGAFRKGGGEVQETVGAPVQTLRMPITAKVFMLFMMMGMMTILLMVILHFVAVGVVSGELERSEDWVIRLEGFRRLGIAMYLFGIALGLATIINVLRFQA
ncbi:MAG: hypothetical protein ACE5KX_05335, partial [Acidimicrobiia bacterium]